MSQALSKAAIESEITSRFHSAFKPRAKATEVISAGIPEVDALTGGLPRGAITEIFGPASSGRTSLMLAALAHASTHDEVCALIDTSDTFDPLSAVNAQMDLERLLWVRCNGKLEHAFKATDLLLQGGGFGLVVLDLGDVAGAQARRIISSWWYRFRRVVEHKPTALVVIAADTCVRSCAALTLETGRESAAWVALNDSAIPLNPQAATPDSKLETRIFNQPPFLVRGSNAHSSRRVISSKPPLSEQTKTRSNMPTHSIILRRTDWLLERLKPVHPGERVVRFKSQAS